MVVAHSEKSLGLGGVLSDVGRLGYLGRDRSAASVLDEYVRNLAFRILLPQDSLFQGLKGVDAPRVDDDLIDVIDVDWAANIQTTRLREKNVIVAVVAVVVIGLLS